MTDIMQEIKRRLSARAELGALLDSGGRGTLKHRVLDDMLYSLDIEEHIRFLMARVEALEAENAQAKHLLREMTGCIDWMREGYTVHEYSAFYNDGIVPLHVKGEDADD